MYEAGRVGVRVMPLTDKFNADLKSYLERIEKNLKVEVKIDIDESKLERLATKLKQIKDLSVGVDVDTAHAEKRLDDLTDKVREAPVVADPDTAWASARLAALARPRTAEIVPIVNEAAARLAEKSLSAIGALGGGRVLKDWTTSLTDMLRGMDKATPKIMLMGSAMGGLTSALGAAVSNLFVFGGDLLKILPIVAAAPGIMAGFGIGAGVMIAALKDTNKVLGDLGPRFTRLQDQLSANFWAKAEQPIRRLANEHWPAFAKGVRDVSTELGYFFTGLANGINAGLDGGALERMFENLRRSIDIAGDGIGWFSEALMNLGEIGSQYLPRMASWFNDMSESFLAWTENADITGMIDEAIRQFGYLMDVLGGIGDVFGAINRAAQEAGGSGLKEAAEGLERMAEAMNAPGFQGALVSFFETSHQAMAIMSRGLGEVASALGSFMPTLTGIMRDAAYAIEDLLGAVAAIMEHPALQNGLALAFEGIRNGVAGLTDGAEPLAQILGQLAELFGHMAEVLGPLIGDALVLLAPIFVDLMRAIEPLIEPMAELIFNLLAALVPIVAPIIEAIADWVAENPELAATLVVIAAVVGSLIGLFISFVTTMMPVITAVMGFIALVGPVGAGVVAAVIAIVGAIAGLVTIIMLKWEEIKAKTEEVWTAISDWFQTTWQGISDWWMETWGGAVNWFNETLTGVSTWWNEVWTAVSTFFTETWTIISEWWTELWGGAVNWFMEVTNGISEWWNEVWTGISTAFTDAWTLISESLNTVFSPMVTLIQEGTASIAEWWGPRWQSIQEIFTVVWTAISTFASTKWNEIVTNFRAVFDPIVAWWNGIWEAITNFVRVKWTQISSSVSNGINAVWSYISSRLATIQASWTTAWNMVANFVKTVWNGIVTFIQSVITNISTYIQMKLAVIKANWTTTWNTVKATVTAVWNSIIAIVGQKVEQVLSFFRELPNQIANALRVAIAKATTIGSQIMQGLADGIRGAGGAVLRAIGGAVDGAIRHAQNLLGINSPSRVFRAFGRGIDDGLAKGIIDDKKKAVDAIGTLIKEVNDYSKKAIDTETKRLQEARRQQNNKLRAINAKLGKKDKKLRLLPTLSKAEAEKMAKRNVAPLIGAQKKIAAMLARQDNTTKAIWARGATKGIERLLAALNPNGVWKKGTSKQTRGTTLADLAYAREKMAERIEAANKKLEDMIDYRDKFADKIKGELDLYKGAGPTMPPTFESVSAQVTTLANRARVFAGKLKRLIAAGIPRGLITEVAGLGSAKGIQVADALLSGSKTQIKKLKQDYTALDTYSKAAGNYATEAFYGIGIAAQQGIIKGLKADDAKLKAAAQHLAKLISKEAKKALGIKSPSRVFTEIGRFTGEGFHNGLVGSFDSVRNGMAAVTHTLIRDAEEFKKNLDSVMARETALAPINMELPDWANAVRSRGTASLANFVSEADARSMGAGDIYHLNFSIDDLKGIKTLEELITTLRLRTRLAGKE